MRGRARPKPRSRHFQERHEGRSGVRAIIYVICSRESSRKIKTSDCSLGSAIRMSLVSLTRAVNSGVLGSEKPDWVVERAGLSFEWEVRKWRQQV